MRDRVSRHRVQHRLPDCLDSPYRNRRGDRQDNHPANRPDRHLELGNRMDVRNEFQIPTRETSRLGVTDVLSNNTYWWVAQRQSTRSTRSLLRHVSRQRLSEGCSTGGVQWGRISVEFRRDRSHPDGRKAGAGDGVQRPEYQTVGRIHLPSRLTLVTPSFVSPGSDQVLIVSLYAVIP